MAANDDLRAIGLLNDGKERLFEQVVKLAARMLNAEICLLTMIDEPQGRQYLKAAHGLPPMLEHRWETPLPHSFCEVVCQTDRPLIISDVRADDRFKRNEETISFGASACLCIPIERAASSAIGALCAISLAPRAWDDEDIAALETLAAGISSQIQLRLALLEAKRVTFALETARQRFADLAANVPGAIFQYVMHPDGSDEVEYMSPGCHDIWETTAEEIEKDASRLWEIIVKEDIPGMQASIQRSAERLARWEHRWRIVTSSGRKKWLQGFGRPKQLEGGSILWNSLILDVTTEAEAQRKARETERLLAEAQKQESIGRLAGGVAHDFNNLLSIIMANADILLSGQARETSETLLGDIVDAAKRGSDLTKSLLSFARRSDLRPVAIDANETINGMHNLFRRALPKRISINSTLMAGLWQVKVDRSGLESALLNLVLNARDAMPEGGTLTIETANVRIVEDYIDARGEDIPPGRYVMIAVSDTGTGILPEILERVFEPFVTTKGPDQGSGLGLAMVQGFAKQSGGTVRIYSEPGHGTAVKIYLPAQSGREVIKGPQAAQETDSTVGRVLLVEDNDIVRRSFRRTLEAAGFTVNEAESGDAALSIIDADDPVFDVVVTDVVMPGRLQGPDLARHIRSRWPDIPVIFISGYPHEANVHGNGVRDNDISLMKPVARLDLLTAITRLLAARPVAKDE